MQPQAGLRTAYTPTVRWGAMEHRDAEAFAAVARDQLPWLRRLARRLAGDDAEDAVQECLLKAHGRFHTLRDRQAAPAWLRQILVNEIRDRHRRRSRRPSEEPVDELGEHTPGDAAGVAGAAPPSALPGDLDRDDVWRVLDRVEPRYRVPLVLAHVEGMPTRRIAWMFGVRQGTVLSWLHRGRARFQRELRAYADERRLTDPGP